MPSLVRTSHKVFENSTLMESGDIGVEELLKYKKIKSATIIIAGCGIIIIVALVELYILDNSCCAVPIH